MQPVNLLPSDERPTGLGTSSTSVGPGPGPDAGDGAGAGAPIGALTLLAVLAIAVIAVALHVQGTNTVKDRKAELAVVTARTTAVQARAGQLERYTAFAQLAATRQQTVGALAKGRFDWAPTLRDIARVLPGDAYLATVCGDAGAGKCSDVPLRAGLPNATAVTMTGCTTSQDAVATLMTRLRDVRGVTRVTLDSSTRPAVTADAAPSAAASAAGGADATTRLPCPKGDPPAFSLVAFFERAPIAAAGQSNGTAAATATPAPGATATATPAAGATSTPAPGATATATPAAATPTATPATAAAATAGSTP